VVSHFGLFDQRCELFRLLQAMQDFTLEKALVMDIHLEVYRFGLYIQRCELFRLLQDMWMQDFTMERLLQALVLKIQ
jgi:hypothetical protein